MSNCFNGDNESCILGGIISVNAAIYSGKRKIERVFVDLDKYKKRDRKITSFISNLKRNGIPYELCERELIDSFVREHDENGGNSHGGVVAVVGKRQFDNVYSLLDKCAEENGYIVFLDGVEDPFNFGYSLRCLYAFGASGVVVPERNWASAAGVCARASAGASELISIACAPDLSTPQNRLEFLSEIKKRGYTVACAAVSSTSVAVDKYNYKAPLILFIGGEKRGISPEFAENADVLLHIPYANKNVRYSLPTAEAASIFGMQISLNLGSRNDS